MANKYVFTNDAAQIMKEQFINETRKALKEYDPDEADPTAMIASIGSMMSLLDSTIQALDKDDDKDDQQ